MKRSHTFVSLSASRLHRLTLIGLIIVLFMTGSIEAPYSQDNILIIDLSKTLPSNPYQTEYEKMLYPTVRIKTLSSTGSGVIIDLSDKSDRYSSGATAGRTYILTAAHVVGNQSEVTIEVFDKGSQRGLTSLSTTLTASVVLTDTVKDLALLKPSRPLSYTATLAPESYTPYIFCPVYTVGCSLGLTPRPSQGIISVIDTDHWEVSSPILPGNSGGPVYNANTYELIGIAVWVHTYKNQIITTMAGIVPINQIYEFLKSDR